MSIGKSLINLDTTPAANGCNFLMNKVEKDSNERDRGFVSKMSKSKITQPHV